ncbi:NACHT domain-containing protein [Crossiella sp. CA-258035]|uniref:NACHT domain-containing protein n=1 Tax=Crossiella sp. CA-258035 TaxID=2981138 RepID=UPI0024BD0CAF|nr:NACHT domain-containing protein [Crossiella sp. CA-258035]WHT19156.1 NACHT domain-containing protein [Crossiella sp. CA-258035]
MSQVLLEAALLKLGTAAVRTATKLWLADDKVAAEVGANAVDLVSERFGNQRDKRRFARMLETFAEAVVDRLEPVIEAEFAALPEHERAAAVHAVQDTFEQAALVDKDLFAADLDARHLDRALRRQAPGHAALLSADTEALYDLLLRESCGYVIEIARGLPAFSTAALTELLRRDTEIINGIREVLARLPQRDRSAGFDYDYRQQAARKLDHIELFGVTLDDASRRYPLSVAYISLTADTGHGRPERIEDLLARSSKLFIRGEAGLGKTTLLHWIAVRSARRDFPPALAAWNQTIPFFVPLRRYADRDLPRPEQFLDEVGRHIADEMPKGWVQQHLRGGHAVVLIDGVDELAPARREEARDWLRHLTLSFPEARWVITSRPGAAQPDWLATDGFLSLDLQPMTPADVRTFIHRWHTAMQSLSADEETKAQLESYHQNLRTQLDTRNHLRRLAGYPPPVGLNRTENALLLGDLAYWLIRKRAQRHRNRTRHRAVGPPVALNGPGPGRAGRGLPASADPLGLAA